MGYEIKRFVDAKESDLGQMTCMICSDIYSNPVLTACCQQVFCDLCIKQWLETNRTCPYDNKALKVNELMPAPVAIKNILNRFKIHCAFFEKGCPEICTVDIIENHERFCRYDKEICKSCGFVATSEHDCLKELLEYKRTMQTLMDRQKKELEDANFNSRNLRSQIENYMRTIQDLAKDRLKEREKSTLQQVNKSQVNTNRDILIEARKFTSSPVVDSHRCKKEMVDKVLEVVKEAVTIRGDRIYDVCKFIKDFMDANYLGDWNCYFLYNNLGFVFHNIIQDSFMEIKFGKVIVTIYKTFDTIGFSRMVSFLKAGIIKNLIISKSGFDEAATGEIEKLSIEILKNCTDMNQFTDRITNELTTNYGGTWHCFLYKATFGFYCIRSEKGQFVLFTVGDIKILIFQ